MAFQLRRRSFIDIPLLLMGFWIDDSVAEGKRIAIKRDGDG